ncbi:hypothetical protein AB0A05_26815 [Streptomyces sp. NPDC046374]|uniref:hypothetical protein n=1 Tax=Streptomyces sp. NPDC046374 TaxID=3154917 RepID=UPI0033EA5112
MKAKRRRALGAAATAHARAADAARTAAREWLRAGMPELWLHELGGLYGRGGDIGEWRLWVDSDGVRVDVEAGGVPGPVWASFLTVAVDRLWFQQAWPGGVSHWWEAPVGEDLHTEAYRRSEFADLLVLDEERRAAVLQVRGLEVKLVVAGLIAMRREHWGPEGRVVHNTANSPVQTSFQCF